MDGTSRAVRWGMHEPQARDGLRDDGAARAVAASVARAHRAAAIAAVQARNMAERSRTAASLAQSIGRHGIAAASLSLSCTGALLVPVLVPHDCTFAVTLASFLLGLGSTFLFAFQAVRFGSKQEVRLSEASARAWAVSKFGERLARTIVEMGDAPDDSTIRAVVALVNYVEAEAGDLGRQEATTSSGISALRRHKRIVPRQRRVIIKTTDGRNLFGTIANLSVSGVALSGTLPRVEIGDEVLIGRRAAVVRRRWEKGMVLQFKAVLEPDHFDEDIVL